MADDSDVPPLEDMSDLMEKIQVIRDKRETKSKNTSTPNKTHVTNGHAETNVASRHSNVANEKQINKADLPQPSPSKDKNQSVKETKSTTQSSSGFGGMKKGFMFGGSSKPKPAKEISKEPITVIKKTDESLKIDEVQQAMNDTITKRKDEWLTDDLLSQIEKNETLLKKLQDPKFMEAVNMFQTNPTAASEKYKNDKETQDAFLQFCGLMGNHFSNIGEKEAKTETEKKPTPKIIEEIDPSDPDKYVPSNPPSASQRGTILTRQSGDGADMSIRSSTNPHQATADDEKKMQDILSRPEIMEVLTDPWIQNLFSVLRTNPDSGQRLLNEANHEKKKKIKKLVDVGLLQLQA